MGKYLDILKRAGLYDKNDINDKSPSAVSAAAPVTPFWSYKSFLSYYLRSGISLSRPYSSRPLATVCRGRKALPGDMGQSGASPRLDVGRPVRPAHPARQAAPILSTALPL